MPPLPDWLIGAWRRAGIAEAGAEEFAEPGDVFWLQAGELYADIRTGALPQRAFAGTSRWTPPVLEWEHAVDTDPDGGADRGRLEWKSGILLESGSWPDGTPYVERWHRLAEAEPLAVETSIDGDTYVVRVGSYEASVSPRGAVLLELVDGAWTERARVEGPR